MDRHTENTKVAYIMSRFPKLTETFILFEMLAVETLQVDVPIYPLLRARKTGVVVEGASLFTKIVDMFSSTKGEVVMHPEAKPLVDRANYLPLFSWAIFVAQLRFLFSKPSKYFWTLGALVKANWGSWNYLIGGLTIFPKMAYAASLMQKEGVGHVHAHFANHPAAAAFIVHHLTDIPYSFTAHGADLQVDQHMLCEKIRDSAFTVTISQYNKAFIIEKCGNEHADKIIVLYCGVDTSIFYPDADRKTQDPFTIMCTGTMYEVKGHTYLIEACRLLQERGINFVCNLVGEGEFQPALEEQVRQAGLQSSVLFLGRKTRDEIAALLRQTDVVVTPSIPTESGRREGIPVVIMEAMASGVPVVASEISGIPELITNGNDGLLVPPRDPAAIADALDQLHKDPILRQTLGANARATVLERFDLHKNASELVRRYSHQEQ